MSKKILFVSGAIGALAFAFGACSTSSVKTNSVVSSKIGRASRGLASVDYRVLTVTKQGTGSGVVTSRPEGLNCGANCTLDVKNARQVRIFALADSGSTFAGWSLESCGTNAECKVKMSTDVAVVATFNQTACPSTAPFLCEDGSCALDSIACNAPCPSDAPFQCPDGACALSSTTCPTSPCPMGQTPCTLNPSVCVAPGETCAPLGCPSDAPYRCTDGSCALSDAFCSTR